jgi:alkylation response protein AidB-like acyl-CoA dehydrogenase
MSFVESRERTALREAVTTLADRYGWRYCDERARRGEPLTELWQEAGRAGFLGVNLPEEFGGGGAGIYELSLVLEELATAGCPLLMMVVSPAICGTIIARFGTEDQRKQWLPGLADGSTVMAFGITEPDAGSNSHRISTIARRDGSDWLLTGRKVFVTGVGNAAATLIVARTEDARTGRLAPALFVVPREAPGFEHTPIPMDIVEPERQYQLYLDDVRLPAEALVGERDAALAQLFAGLNPERIMAAASATGTGRYALRRAVRYAGERQVWSVPIGAHQGVAHPLARVHIEIELARLALQKAATLYDAGDDEGAGECANMAKYAAAEASIAAVDQAIQTHGGNGLASEYGLGSLLAWSRIGRVAPVSREMILNFVAQHSLGLPRSY